MTLGTLGIWIGGAALVYMLLVKFLLKKDTPLLLLFLQGFAGILFIVSGFVKAIDPMGTAFKMQQYFAEFQATFKGSFLEGLFPWFAAHATGFSIFIIVFEMVLGLMLLIGARKRLVSWLFFLLVIFFTMLTGFTFLTGYVPSGVNFFEFGKWGVWAETNMKVTDCGCFGDFLKLKPYTSFLKDLVLLVPAVIFLFYSRSLATLFTRKVRVLITVVATIASLLFCWANTFWNEPPKDFRPFKVGVHLGQEKAKEMDALGSIKISAFEMKNKQTGELKTVAYDDYMKNFKDYPAETWETVKQIKSEPAIPITKISEFEINNLEGFPYAEEYIHDSAGYVVMILSYHPEHNGPVTEKIVRMDTTWIADTIRVNNVDTVVRRLDKVNQLTEEKFKELKWDPKYLERYREYILPFTTQAAQNGWKVIVVTASVENPLYLEDLKKKLGVDYEFFTADDLLLKTMMRSNPGLFILHNGKIVAKYHYLNVPKFESAKQTLIE